MPGSATLIPIDDIIQQNMPVGLSLDIPTRDNLISKYQRWLQPLVNPAVIIADTHTESAYDPLANQLIAELVVLDLIDLGARAFMVSQGNQTGAPGREVKKVTTGPSDAEWFSKSDTWTNILGEGGIKDQLMKSTCGLAARIRVVLPWCPPLSYSPIPPQKYYPPNISTSTPNSNPFGITDNML